MPVNSNKQWTTPTMGAVNIITYPKKNPNILIFLVLFDGTILQLPHHQWNYPIAKFPTEIFHTKITTGS
jgi:hypothetical protein